ncbi:MAG: hypothetical protein LBE08_10395 [Bifidobacteriaceae bacterium]|jgi:hypothetical protein|nr:hypothetical protein [Bifidobacteriaceae bacterium]
MTSGFLEPVWECGLERFTPGLVDSHGNPTDGWGAPTDVLVYGWGPPAADQTPFEAGRSEIDRDLDLYAPPNVHCGPRDRWTIDGVVYTQIGWAEDFGHGPFGFVPGARVNLRRVEG